MPEDEFVTMGQYALDVEDRLCQIVVSSNMLKVTASYNPVIDDVVLMIRHSLLNTRGHDYQHPADWWQAFKQRCFPWRWRQWWPVQMKTVRPRAFFPENEIPLTEAEKLYGRVTFDWGVIRDED